MNEKKSTKKVSKAIIKPDEEKVTVFERKVVDRPISHGDVVVGVNEAPYLVAWDDDGNRYAVNMINGHVNRFEDVEIAEVINVKIVEV